MGNGKQFIQGGPTKIFFSFWVLPYSLWCYLSFLSLIVKFIFNKKNM